MDDEAWRDGLDDGAATPLLDWALARTDESLARAAAAGGAGGDLRDLAYDAAGQARDVLAILAGLWNGEPEERVWRRLGELLGPPLFENPAAGRAAVGDALEAAGRAVPRG